MKYISGIHALNTPCSLNTMGDWHVSALQWDNPCMYDTNDSIFKDFGIEYNKKIPEHTQTYPVANHIRACLDLIDHGMFGYVQGMNRDFISNKEYNEIIFSKVLLLKNHNNWNEINDFMNKEFKMDWVVFSKSKAKEAIMPDTCWHKEHRRIIDSFLQFLNQKTDLFILSDGVALMLFYGLTRFSDDIYLDAPKKQNKIFNTIVKEYCIKNSISFIHEKNSQTHSCFYLNYNGDIHPLKIEARFRHFEKKSVIINQIRVYEIDELISEKILLFNHKKKIRDLFDIVFICNHYWNQLDARIKSTIIDSFSYLEYDFFEMLFVTQNDELIDLNLLKESFKEFWLKIE